MYRVRPFVTCEVRHFLKVVFLDDLGVNLKEAKKLGITTILVKDPVNAIKDLEQVMDMKTLLSMNSSRL